MLKNISQSNPATINQPWFDMPFVCVDCETTGLDPRESRIIEIAWVHTENQQVTKAQSRLCSVPDSLPARTIEITGITDDMLVGKPPFAQYADEIIAALQQTGFIVAYNADFDRRFLEHELKRIGKSLPEKPWVDPYIFIREIDKYKRGKRLTDAAGRWGVTLNDAHRAQSDAVATAQLLCKLANQIPHRDLNALVKWQEDLKRQQEMGFREYLAKKQQNSIENVGQPQS